MSDHPASSGARTAARKPHLVSRVLLRQWADHKGGLIEIAVGSGCVKRTGPKGIMFEEAMAGTGVVSRLERAWEQRRIEKRAGDLLRRHRNRSVSRLAKDVLQEDDLSQAIRNLVYLHFVRSMETTLLIHDGAAQRVEAILDADDVRLQALAQVVSAAVWTPVPPVLERQEQLLNSLAEQARSDLVDGVSGHLPEVYDKLVEARAPNRLQLALAPQGREFALGDAPAYFAGVDADGNRHFGMAAADAGAADAIVMPISPRLFAYVGPLSDDADRLPTLDPSAVDELNRHQCERAVRSVTVSSNAPHEMVEQIRGLVRGNWGIDPDGTPRGAPTRAALPPVETRDRRTEED